MTKIEKYFLILFVLALLFGLYARINNLGAVGYSGDEETTLLATMGIEEYGRPTFPTGMEYNRGLVHSYILHYTFKIFEINEFSARLPSLLFGIVLILFVTLIGYQFSNNLFVGFAAGILISLHAYHIEMSRTVRMYEIFALFNAMYLYFVLRYFKSSSRKDLALLVFTFLISIFSHEIGIFSIIIFALIFILKDSITDKIKIFSTSVILSIIWFFQHKNIGQAYKKFNPLGSSQDEMFSMPGVFTLENLFILIGVALVVWGLFQIVRHRWFKISMRWQFVVCTLFLAVGLIHLGWIAFLFLALYFRKIEQDSILTFGFGILCSLIYFIIFYYFSANLIDAIKLLLTFPYFTELYILERFPLLVLSTLILILFSKELETNKSNLLVFSVISGLVILSFFGSEFHYRYLVFLIPINILIYASASFVILKKLKKFKFNWIIVSIFLLVCVNEVFPYKYITSYVNTSYGNMIFPWGIGRPDHKGAADYVKKYSTDEDIIISIDALQTYLYLGRADYWLRNREDLEQFLYLNSNNELRDIYVNSKALLSLSELKQIIEGNQTVWLIDSGETFLHKNSNSDFNLRGYYLPKDVIEFINASEDKKVYEGRDGATDVYKFN